MDKKSFLILLSCTLIAGFLGALIAIYSLKPRPVRIVPPMFGEFRRPPRPGDFEDAMERQEKIFERDMKFFDKFESDMDDLIENSPNAAGFIQMNNAGLKTIETPKEYKIEIDLKPFGKNEKNVNLKIKGNTVKISAGYKSDDKNNYSSSQFYQALSLPGRIDAKAVKRVRKGDILTIIIPKR